MTFSEIRVKCIAHGAVMTVTGTDCTITEMIDAIKEEDKDARFEEQFFTRGGKGGNRDTKTAVAQSITVKKFSGNTSVDIVAETSDGDDVTIRVGKKQIDQYPAAILDLGVLSEKTRAKIEKAFNSEKGGGTCILGDGDQFIVKYFDIDGSCYAESVEKGVNND